jgi:anti-sigma regulatory factor (Ser/Thr protein kinase)
MTGTEVTSTRTDTFRHEAMFYAGLEGFISTASDFIRDAVAAGEPMLVVVSADKIDALTDELGSTPPDVEFADMKEVGKNPARIIPAWREFMAEQSLSGRRFRGIGEPIWKGRTADELVEAERHESLLNLAFSGTPAWWLACPYDTVSLGPAVLEEARRNHPFILTEGVHRESASYRSTIGQVGFQDDPLPEPDIAVRRLAIEPGALAGLRAFVYDIAADGGLSAGRADDLVLAVNEIATNTLRHAGGRGTLRMWTSGSSIICEVRDTGHIADPLIGRARPILGQEGGFGMWLVHQLCDLVQVRSLPDGSVVRIHMLTD